MRIMTKKDVRFFYSQKKMLDSFFVGEARAKRKEKELGEIMGAKYGTDPRNFN